MFTVPEKGFNGEDARAGRETVLKRVNLVVFVIAFGCFVITVADVTQKVRRSVTSFWVVGDEFELDDALNADLASCNYTGEMEVSYWEFPFTMSVATRGPMMAHATGLIRRAVWLSGTALVLGGINKLLFAYDVHEVSFYDGIVTARKGYLTFLEIIAVVWAIVALARPQELCDYISDYIAKCDASDRGVDHIWKAPPFIAMFVGLGVTLLVHVVTYVLLVYYSQPQENKPAPPLLRKRWRELQALVAMRRRKLAHFEQNPNAANEALVEVTALQLLQYVRMEAQKAVERGLSSHAASRSPTRGTGHGMHPDAAAAAGLPPPGYARRPAPLYADDGREPAGAPYNYGRQAPSQYESRNSDAVYSPR